MEYHNIVGAGGGGGGNLIKYLVNGHSITIYSRKMYRFRDFTNLYFYTSGVNIHEKGQKVKQSENNRDNYIKLKQGCKHTIGQHLKQCI